MTPVGEVVDGERDPGPAVDVDPREGRLRVLPGPAERDERDLALLQPFPPRLIHRHGLFHIAPEGGDVVSIEMESGDMIRVPRGTKHWFNLCGDRTVRAIRLFQDVSGWAPHYTDSGVDTGYQPLCFGVSYIPTNF